MVILIGAESMTGKTLMAQKLLETYRIPYLSADLLKMGLYRSNKHCGFKPDDSNEDIEYYLWPFIKGIIETTIENEQSIIIEGAYIFPNRIKELKADYIDKIIPVFMGFSQRYIEKNFESGIIKHRSAIEFREEPDERPIEWFIQAHNEWKLLCAESSVEYFEIDGDYEKDISKVYQWIDHKAEQIKNCKSRT